MFRTIGVGRQNPLFGLNTLGGALALRTKTGFSFQGTELEASGGSFGRWAVDDSNELDTVDDYAIVNLHTRIRVWKHAELWARVDNVFDTDYEICVHAWLSIA